MLSLKMWNWLRKRIYMSRHESLTFHEHYLCTTMREVICKLSKDALRSTHFLDGHSALLNLCAAIVSL